MELDFNDVLQAYKAKIDTLTNENVMLQAQINYYRRLAEKPPEEVEDARSDS